jgi:hypothetical protein
VACAARAAPTGTSARAAATPAGARAWTRAGRPWRRPAWPPRCARERVRPGAATGAAPWTGERGVAAGATAPDPPAGAETAVGAGTEAAVGGGTEAAVSAEAEAAVGAGALAGAALAAAGVCLATLGRAASGVPGARGWLPAPADDPRRARRAAGPVSAPSPPAFAGRAARAPRAARPPGVPWSTAGHPWSPAWSRACAGARPAVLDVLRLGLLDWLGLELAPWAPPAPSPTPLPAPCCDGACARLRSPLPPR